MSRQTVLTRLVLGRGGASREVVVDLDVRFVFTGPDLTYSEAVEAAEKTMAAVPGARVRRVDAYPPLPGSRP